MTTTNKMGIYVHIPFCMRKCKYCDFLSLECNNGKTLSEYAKAVMKEIKMVSSQRSYGKVDSVYIGGGTPSVLSSSDVGKILDCIREHFDVTDDAEITIEANPSSVSDEKLAAYLRKGINRISIGVQAFDNYILTILGRIHNKNDAFHAFQAARKAGFENINMDLIFGIPGQTMKMWKDSVRQCIFLKPSHISLYSLQIEKGTEMYKAVYDEGKLTPISDMADRLMYHTALKMIEEAGYDHYEISNAALPGYISRHNMKYWSYDEYLGIGLGASSFIDGSRYENMSGIKNYVRALNEGIVPVDEKSIEKYSEREEMGIFMFTGLRKTEGIDVKEFERVFGKEFFDVYDINLLNKYRGSLLLNGDRLFLSEKGIDVSNKIMAEFV